MIRAREFANNFPFRSFSHDPITRFQAWPLLLTPLIKLAGPHWTSLERLSIGVTLLSVFLLWKWTNRWLSKGESLVVTALFAPQSRRGAVLRNYYAGTVLCSGRQSPVLFC